VDPLLCRRDYVMRLVQLGMVHAYTFKRAFEIEHVCHIAGVDQTGKQ
jgi:hypothetical protein